jgi:hypothetical protein
VAGAAAAPGPTLSVLRFATPLAVALACFPFQAKRGGLKDTDAIDLMATVFKATLDRTGVEPQVCVLAGGVAEWGGRDEYMSRTPGFHPSPLPSQTLILAVSHTL